MATRDADPRQRALELVRRHGWNAMAFQALEAGYDYYFHDDSCVAYVDTGSAWVVAGGPIAAAEDLPSVTKAFLDAARRARRRVSFFGIESRFLERTSDLGITALQVGEQPVFDPRNWPTTLAQHRHLREQLRRARAKRVIVRELGASELAERSMQERIGILVEQWLATRALAPMGFLVRIEPFSFPNDRRVFVAEQDGTLVAFAGVIPVPNRDGWFLEDLVRAPDAPNGTGELLVDAAMRSVARTSTWFTLGLAPLAGNVGRALVFARQAFASLYDFGGLYRYKAKFRPDSFWPIFLAYPSTQGPVRSVVDALRAFAPGGFLRFGLATFLRGPKALLRWLTMLLIPWIILLAFAPAEPWFGAPAAKWAWIVFDVVVFVALRRLLRQPTVIVATLLALAVTSDCGLTLVSVLRNPALTAHLASLGIAAVACLAPAVAATLLWGTRTRLARQRDLEAMRRRPPEAVDGSTR